MNECEGSDLYRENIKHLEKGIAKLKTPEGRNTIKVSKDKQKITDGIRPCWYGGARYGHQSRFFLRGPNNLIDIGFGSKGRRKVRTSLLISSENCVCDHTFAILEMHLVCLMARGC